MMVSRTSSETQLPEAEKHSWNSSTPPNDEKSISVYRKENEKDVKDPNLVDWDGDDDQDNPRNWPNGYKYWITFQLGMLALAASLGSSIISPANQTIGKYVGVSSEVSVLSISLYM
jgi:hypothetical protein